MDIYNSGEYLEHNPTWHEEDAEWKAAHVKQLLDAAGIRPGTVAEVGCGVGGVVAVLAAAMSDTQFYGFDISGHAIDRAREKRSGNLAFEQHSPFGESTVYDVALALDVFEHVEDYFEFLRNMKTVSRYQVYNIPLDLSVRSMLQKSILRNMRDRIGHLHYFTKETALATLAATGHKVIGSIQSSKTLLYGEVSPPRWPLVAFRRSFYKVAPELAVTTLGGFALTVLCE